MLSHGGIYALQAVLYLARWTPEGPVPAARIAQELGVPPEYLAKVLQRLGQEGLLASARGARGGYRLAHAPEAITVERVVHAFEEVEPLTVCLLGGRCSSDDPCSAHLHRLEWNEARLRILASTTLADLLAGSDGSPDATAAAPAVNDSSHEEVESCMP